MNQLKLASNRLYGEGGLGVSDFKMSLGAQRDVSKDQIAEQINRSLSQIENGDFEIVDND